MKNNPFEIKIFRLSAINAAPRLPAPSRRVSRFGRKEMARKNPAAPCPLSGSGARLPLGDRGGQEGVEGKDLKVRATHSVV